MASIEKKNYFPIPENVKAYNQLFTEYKKLHDYFGRGINQVIERLKKIENKICFLLIIVKFVIELGK
jgi:L-ribulokinase